MIIAPCSPLPVVTGGHRAGAMMGEEPLEEPVTLALDTVIGTARRFLYLPDPAPPLLTLAAVAANRMTGDPVWLLLVGPSSSGKTEILTALAPLPEAIMVSTVSEAGLLSGATSRHGRGGTDLMTRLGERGLIVYKDLTSLLAEHHETRAKIFAALREIYDGRWSRHLGVGGGLVREWQGHAGLVGAVTEEIEEHANAMGSVGERFLWTRMPLPDRMAVADKVLSTLGQEAERRDELAEAVAGFFAALPAEAPAALDAGERLYLSALADFVTGARSAVIRRRHGSELQYVPAPESVGRVLRVLAGLVGGFRAIGVGPLVTWELVTRTALDSIPALRLRCLRALIGEAEPLRTATVGDWIGYPTSTAHRALDDLAAHRLVVRDGSGGNAHGWTLADSAREQMRALGVEPWVAMAVADPLEAEVADGGEDLDNY